MLPLPRQPMPGRLAARWPTLQRCRLRRQLQAAALRGLLQGSRSLCGTAVHRGLPRRHWPRLAARSRKDCQLSCPGGPAAAIECSRCGAAASHACNDAG
jgi:hypothetical protein